MKRTYIPPKATAYEIQLEAPIMSVSLETGEGNSGDVADSNKKEEGTSNIWNYNFADKE